jgi:signal transduction histidine kinase
MSSRIVSDDVKKKRILLIAESPLESRWIKRMLNPVRNAKGLRQGDFIVKRANNSELLFNILHRQHFDAVLVDFGLPSSDDLMFLEKIISAAPLSPIIVLTGFDENDIALKAIQFGAQDCIYKERIDHNVLRLAVIHAIERKKRESKLSDHTRQLETARFVLEQQANELRSYMEQMDRINHELEEFTYIASHDLKEPLRGISSYCEIILEDYKHKLDADGKRRLTTAVQLCDRTENLINDLLTYCHVGRKAEVKTRLNLNTVVANLLKMFRPSIERKKALVQINKLLPSVMGNSTLISMVFSNLISNSLKFNDNRRPRVAIGWLPTAPVTFYVKDNGIGIAEEHHDAIFTIFRRLHSRKKYEGSGAGLTIVKKIVELHGGRIWLRSSPGAGTTFYFTLAGKTADRSTRRNIHDAHWSHHSHHSTNLLHNTLSVR